MEPKPISISLSSKGIKKAWQVKEPEDQTDPVTHESFTVEKYSPDEMILGASIRGKRHAHMGKFREDAYAWGNEGKFRIMAVADGAGSCPLSRIGAETAASQALEYLRSKLKHKGYDHNLTQWMTTRERSANYLKDACLHAIKSIGEEANKRHCEANKMATTLLLALTWPENTTRQFTVLQVGDGLIVLSGQNNSLSILGSQDKGTYISQSKFITSRGILKDLGSKIVTRQADGPGFLALMTDGISDDFYPPHAGLENFEYKMKKILSHAPHPENEIKKWIHYEKKGSYDDRTIILHSFG